MNSRSTKQGQLSPTMRKAIAMEIEEMIREESTADHIGSTYDVAKRLGIAQSSVSNIVKHHLIGAKNAKILLDHRKLTPKQLIAKHQSELGKTVRVNSSELEMDLQTLEMPVELESVRHTDSFAERLRNASRPGLKLLPRNAPVVAPPRPEPEPESSDDELCSTVTFLMNRRKWLDMTARHLQMIMDAKGLVDDEMDPSAVQKLGDEMDRRYRTFLEDESIGEASVSKIRTDRPS